MTKATRYDNAVQGFQHFGIPLAHLIEGFRVDPFDMNIHIMVPTGVAQRFRDGQIRVMEFDVFSNQANGQLWARVFNLFYQCAPLLHLRLPAWQTKFLYHKFAQTRLFQDQWYFINRLGRQHWDDSPGFDITE